MQKRATADWELVRKRADWNWHVFRWEWRHSRPCTSARDSAEKLEEIEPVDELSEEEDEHLMQAAWTSALPAPKENEW